MTRRSVEETSAEIMTLCDRLHADGQTIIMVTHEHDIAIRAERLVTLSDGIIAFDDVQRATRPLAVEHTRA